ncbi:MAG: helix-turn-helix transcriptional regulator [Saprospiraceae bacterium]
MKHHIPIFNKDKTEEVWLKVRKLEANFSQDETNHRHTYEELIWVKSGIGAQLIDNQIYSIHPNTLYFISKGQVHNFQEGKNMEAYIIAFDPNFLKTYFPFHLAIISKKLKNFNVIPFTTPEIEEVDLVMHQMLHEFNKPKSTFGRSQTLIWFLMIFLTIIERTIHRLSPINEVLKPDYKFSIYQDLLQLIEGNFKTQHNLSFYTKQLGVSSRNLTSYSKIYAGKTAKQLLVERIIAEAKRLLIFTPQSLTQIATNLGFEETSYFIRFFRIQTRSTPGQFRFEHQA